MARHPLNRPVKLQRAALFALQLFQRVKGDIQSMPNLCCQRPRPMCPFSRAVKTQQAADDGSSISKSNPLSILRCIGSPYFCPNLLAMPVACNRPSHYQRGPCAVGIRPRRLPTSDNLAKVSSNSMLRAMENRFPAVLLSILPR